MNSFLLTFGQEDIINRCHFVDHYFIPLSSGLDHSITEHPTDDKQNFNCGFTKDMPKNSTSHTFRTILELMHRSLVECTNYSTFIQNNINDGCGDNANSTDFPTIAGVAKQLA